QGDRWTTFTPPAAKRFRRYRGRFLHRRLYLTRSGVIKVNWHLIEAPKAVLEYVVLHELSHSAHRNHTPEFWALIAKHMPDYPARKRWLENMMPSFKL
ncbi:M48 family metallopeptidase, partial [Asticcacaulis sp.]|uniref:M48 metallopeptidase family protein n=1 Tax=Asticcacaulis sp. TaxID=1872648 RepID=UPI0031DFCF9A